MTHNIILDCKDFNLIYYTNIFVVLAIQEGSFYFIVQI